MTRQDARNAVVSLIYSQRQGGMVDSVKLRAALDNYEAEARREELQAVRAHVNSDAWQGGNQSGFTRYIDHRTERCAAQPNIQNEDHVEISIDRRTEGQAPLKMSVAVRSLDPKTHSTLTLTNGRERDEISSVLVKAADEIERIIAAAVDSHTSGE